MRTLSLHEEMNAATFAVRQAHIDRLRQLGTTTEVIAAMGRNAAPFGVVNAEPLCGGLYQPGEGMTHIVLPVFEDGDLIDLCAFRSNAPDEWNLRLGAGWALGLQNGVSWHTWSEAARLFNTPLDWLRGGGNGICVLDWQSPELTRLDVLRNVRVTDPTTGKLLEAALSRPVRLPNITLMEAANDA